MIHRHDPHLCQWAVVQGCSKYGTPGKFHLARIVRVIPTGPEERNHFEIDPKSIEGRFGSAHAAANWAEMEMDSVDTYCAATLLE